MIDLTDPTIRNSDKLAFCLLSVLKTRCFRDWPDGCEVLPKTRDISVLIPCCGKADSVARTVRSAAAQTMRPFRILVLLMDEESRALRKELESLSPSVECVDSERMNVCAARNRLVEMCPTEYFVLLDADDEILENFLEEAYRDRNSIVFPIQVSSREAFNDTLFDRPNKREFLNQNFTCLFNKTAFKELGGFDERYMDGFEDTDLMMRLLIMGKYAVSMTGRTCFIYNESPNGLTKRQRFYDGLFQALNDWLPFFKEKLAERRFSLSPETGAFLSSLGDSVSVGELRSFFNDMAGTDVDMLVGNDIPARIFGELVARNAMNVRASFALDPACNTDCPYCNQGRAAKRFPPRSEDEIFSGFDRALTRCESILGYRPAVQILGGEPTLWSDALVRRIQERLSAYDEYLVFTNGFNRNSLFWKDPKAWLSYHVTDWTRCRPVDELPGNAGLEIVVTKKDIHLVEEFLDANKNLKNPIHLAFCHGGGHEYDLDPYDIRRLAEIEWRWRELFPLHRRSNLNFYELYRRDGLKACQRRCRTGHIIWNFLCYKDTVTPCCGGKEEVPLDEFRGCPVSECGDCMFFI